MTGFYRRSVRGSGAEPPREDVTGEELTVAELVRGLYDISQEAVENCNPLVARVAAWGAKRLEEKTAVVDPLEELLKNSERIVLNAQPIGVLVTSRGLHWLNVSFHANTLAEALAAAVEAVKAKKGASDAVR